MPLSHGAPDATNSITQLRYVDHGIERVAAPRNDCEAGATVAVASSSSSTVREYEDKLKAIELRQRGVEKSDIAAKLSRSERWVQKWWKHEPKLLQRPHGAQNEVFQRVPLDGFRDVEFTKSFCQDAVLYDTLAREVQWRRGKVMTRDQETSELVLRFDKRGSTIQASRLVADCPRGIAALDSLLQRAFSKANIRDPQARVVLNLYTDGGQQLNSHRHDFWTCLVSLGAPRVLLVDNRPQVMEDGDMIVFGTQMHGVPPMPAVAAGRISLVVFFYPDRDNLGRRWLTVLSENKDSDATDDEAVHGELTFGDDCRTGSVSSNAVPGASTLAALQAAVSAPESARNRPHWRKTNAELQFMEYPKLPEATVFSAGCGRLTEAQLFTALAQHAVESIWDLRVGPEAALGRLGRERLRQLCRGRLRYREWQMGTASAGGLPRHLRSEEGATMVYRLASEAQRTKVCFFGLDENWRCDDLRMAVGAALIATGTCVVHLRLEVNQTEVQPPEYQLPARLQVTERSLQVRDANRSYADLCLSADQNYANVIDGTDQGDGHGDCTCSTSSTSVANPERGRWERRHAVACKNVVEGDMVSCSSPGCVGTDQPDEFSDASPSSGATERSRGRWGTFSRTRA